VPRASWSGSLQSQREQAEQLCLGTVRGKRRAHDGLATHSICKPNALRHTRQLKFQRPRIRGLGTGANSISVCPVGLLAGSFADRSGGQSHPGCERNDWRQPDGRCGSAVCPKNNDVYPSDMRVSSGYESSNKRGLLCRSSSIKAGVLTAALAATAISAANAGSITCTGGNGQNVGVSITLTTSITATCGEFG
jgi:hypothetical protein